MSNYHAIAAVTATLRSILLDGTSSQADLGDTTVTVLPLDKARAGNSNNQLNLFLYMVVRNAAWVTADLPRQVRPGEVGFAPLPLNLYYLVTAFGANDDVNGPAGHVLLGRAMSVLHDHPVLSAQDIVQATSSMLPSGLDLQSERVRVTFHPLGIEELSKLWTGFAMQYRLSAAYEVGVTLIDSTRAPSAALPVLTRGKSDQGVNSRPDVSSPFPALDAVTLPAGQAAVVQGGTVTLRGRNLDGTQVAVRFFHALWSQPIDLVPATANATSIAIALPVDAALWPAGFYAVSVRMVRPGETFVRETNTLAVAVAPTIAIAPATAAGPDIAYTVTIAPDVRPEQRATLILDGLVFDADPHPAPTGTLTFAATGLQAGDHWIRVRVDGVDTLLVDRSQSPPVFDPAQKVTVT